MDHITIFTKENKITFFSENPDDIPKLREHLLRIGASSDVERSDVLTDVDLATVLKAQPVLGVLLSFEMTKL